ncbi:MAG: hypothetical protein QOE94_4242, partial [Mycobacterium sp.]|nr:hypothetical protein [Mycobacterium sp.]
VLMNKFLMDQSIRRISAAGRCQGDETGTARITTSPLLPLLGTK